MTPNINNPKNNNKLDNDNNKPHLSDFFNQYDDCSCKIGSLFFFFSFIESVSVP